MAIFRAVKNKNYTVIHNGFLEDRNLSLKAKGLLAYFLSKPDDWNFYLRDIIKHARDGKDSISTAIKELMEFGYIERIRNRDERGKFTGGYEYLVYEVPRERESSEDGNNPLWEEAILEESEIKSSIKEKHRAEKWNVDSSNAEKWNSENSKEQEPNSKNPPLLNTKSILNTDKELNTEYILNTNTTTNTDITNNSIEAKSKSYEGSEKEEERLSCSCSCDNEGIYKLFRDNGFGKINEITRELLDDCIKNYSEEALREAMVEAIRHNKYSLSYVEGILKNKFQKSREKEGIKGGDAISSYEEELRRRGCILDLDDL
ncbi:MAG: DnaD domain protein [Clostridiales bacterium]|nr:DnaD domain protein [Clostridiales bacterium]